MVYLIAGVVQAAKNAWLKSGVNLVRSLRYIKDFEEMKVKRVRSK